MHPNAQKERRLEFVYKFICAYWQKNGFAPTIREITNGMSEEFAGQSSTSHTNHLLDVLVERNQIERGARYQTRALRVVGSHWVMPGSPEAELVEALRRGDKIKIFTEWADGVTNR